MKCAYLFTLGQRSDPAAPAAALGTEGDIEGKQLLGRLTPRKLKAVQLYKLADKAQPHLAPHKRR